jgi:hypothetical protein
MSGNLDDCAALGKTASGLFSPGKGYRRRSNGAGRRQSRLEGQGWAARFRNC